MPAKQLKTAGLAFPFVFVDVVRTVIGVRFKDGIVLASENIVVSKLHEPNATKHLFTVDAKLGVVCNSSRYFFRRNIPGCGRLDCGWPHGKFCEDFLSVFNLL